MTRAGVLGAPSIGVTVNGRALPAAAASSIESVTVQDDVEALSMFTIVLNNVSTNGTFKTGGVPKGLYLYVGLVAWSFYSSALITGASSLTGNPLLNKVYAPREVFPISQVATSGIDALIACALFPILCVVFDRMPSLETFYWLIPLSILLVAFAVAITLFVSALTVYARDLRSGLPLITQLGMLMPGIIYPVSRVTQLHSVTAPRCSLTARVTSPPRRRERS